MPIIQECRLPRLLRLPALGTDRRRTAPSIFRRGPRSEVSAGAVSSWARTPRDTGAQELLMVPAAQAVADPIHLAGPLGARAPILSRALSSAEAGYLRSKSTPLEWEQKALVPRNPDSGPPATASFAQQLRTSLWTGRAARMTTGGSARTPEPETRAATCDPMSMGGTAGALSHGITELHRPPQTPSFAQHLRTSLWTGPAVRMTTAGPARTVEPETRAATCEPVSMGGTAEAHSHGIAELRRPPATPSFAQHLRTSLWTGRVARMTTAGPARAPELETRAAACEPVSMGGTAEAHSHRITELHRPPETPSFAQHLRTSLWTGRAARMTTAGAARAPEPETRAATRAPVSMGWTAEAHSHGTAELHRPPETPSFAQHLRTSLWTGRAARMATAGAARAAEPETRAAVCEPVSMCGAAKAHSHGIAVLHAKSALPACTPAMRLVPPQIDFPSTRPGNLESSAAAFGFTPQQECRLALDKSFSLVPDSLPRSLVFCKYSPPLIKGSGGVPAGPQNKRLRSSPASLFSLPKAGGWTGIAYPVPDAVLKPLVLRAAGGPEAAQVSVADLEPSQPLAFSWTGDVASAILLVPPIFRIRSKTFKGSRTRPVPAPPQCIETIRVAIGISMEARRDPSVVALERPKPASIGSHWGSAPARTMPHLLPVRVRPASMVALPVIPAEVLGSGAANRFAPLPESLTEPYGREVESVRGGAPLLPANPAGAAQTTRDIVVLPDGSFKLSTCFAPLREDLRLSSAGPVNPLILKDATDSSLPAQKGPLLSSVIPPTGTALHSDIRGAARPKSTMKKFRI